MLRIDKYYSHLSKPSMNGSEKGTLTEKAKHLFVEHKPLKFRKLSPNQVVSDFGLTLVSTLGF